MPPYLTPQQFNEHINRALGSGDPRSVQNAIQEAMAERFPPLATISADCYPIPASAALFLYRTAPRKHSGLLRASLGSPQSEHYWERLAAIASYVCAAADWQTLGELAYALDGAIAVVGTASLQKPAESGPRPLDRAKKVSPHRLVQVWGEFFHALAGRRAAWFVHVALGYFRVLPAGLAVPPDLVRAEASGPASADQGWPLLRLFWQRHHGAWKVYPEGLSQLEACPNPLLVELAHRIRHSPDPPERAEETSEGVPEPFADLAGEEVRRIAPPPLARPPESRRSWAWRLRTRLNKLQSAAGRWLRSLLPRSTRRSKAPARRPIPTRSGPPAGRDADISQRSAATKEET